MEFVSGASNIVQLTQQINDQMSGLRHRGAQPAYCEDGPSCDSDTGRPGTKIPVRVSATHKPRRSQKSAPVNPDNIPRRSPRPSQRPREGYGEIARVRIPAGTDIPPPPGVTNATDGQIEPDIGDARLPQTPFEVEAAAAVESLSRPYTRNDETASEVVPFDAPRPVKQSRRQAPRFISTPWIVFMTALLGGLATLCLGGAFFLDLMNEPAEERQLQRLLHDWINNKPSTRYVAQKGRLPSWVTPDFLY